MSDTQHAQGGQPIPRHARTDVIAGLFVVGIAVLIWFGAIDLNVGEFPRFEAGAMPKALAVLLLAGGIGVLANGLMQDDDNAERVILTLRPMALVVLSMLIFGLFIRGGTFGFVTTPKLGLTVVGPITVLVAGCATPQLRVGELLVIALGLTAVLLIVFVDLLGVGVPVFPAAVEDILPASLQGDAATRLACGLYGAIAAGLYVLIFRRADRTA